MVNYTLNVIICVTYQRDLATRSVDSNELYMLLVHTHSFLFHFFLFDIYTVFVVKPDDTKNIIFLRLLANGNYRHII